MARLPFDRNSVPEIPRSPGIYVFYDDRGKPLYVGKAAELRTRVRSYFSKAADGRLVTKLLSDLAVAMDFVITGSEKEALLLENSLIKKHAPRLNIRLRDDKTYFSLVLDLGEKWPRLRICRRRTPKDVLYFGPYPSARACRQTIRFLSTIFPLRTCPDSVLNNRSRPCILAEMGRCVAPCVGEADPQHYREIAESMVRFLKGQDREVIKELEAQMLRAAEALRFEKAAEIRDRLKQIRTTLEQPCVARRSGVDRDVVGLYEGEGEVLLCVLHVRDGILESTDSYHLKPSEEIEALLGGFLGQYYSRRRLPPPQVLLPGECTDPVLHREILEELRGAAVELRVPERGEGLRLLRLAEENAQLSAGKRRKEDEDREALLISLQELLSLRQLPRRIECYDISHLGGEQVVGSQVSFVSGVPDKGLYRHYRLREVQRNDDFAALEEVLSRRLKRGVSEGDLPDLIIIDGGRPQLRRVMDVVRSLSLDEVEVVGLAKGRARAQTTLGTHERIIFPDRDAPLVLERSTPVVHLLQRIRDEAHRFAISYSRRLRGKEKVASVLELIPGIGRRRARTLLTHFGSLAQVKSASEEEIAAVKGVSSEVARELKRFFAERS